MEDYAAPFAALIDSEPCDLSADERASLDYYYASVTIAEGLPAMWPSQRWCLMAQDVGRVAHMLGHLPQFGDPGATPAILAWIEEQCVAQLNSYQRARLASLPGGSALLDQALSTPRVARQTAPQPDPDTPMAATCTTAF